MHRSTFAHSFILIPLVAAALPVVVLAAGAQGAECIDARIAAASGYSFGAEQVDMDLSLHDSCVAAVYEASRATFVELDPARNPKNYRCVGKNVRISERTDGTLVKNWSPAPSVPAGTCSVQVCGSDRACADATRIPGVSASVPNVDLGLGRDANSAMPYPADVSAPAQGDALPISARIEDAFGQIEADRFKTDASGNPDVTQLKSPGLESALQRKVSDAAFSAYERESGASLHASQAQTMRELSELSGRLRAVRETSVLSPTSLSGHTQLLGGMPTPESYAAMPSTFQENSSDSFWSSWRRSNNIDDERPTVSSSPGLVPRLGSWFSGLRERTAVLWSRLFR